MDKIFEQCTVDRELTPELIKRKQELDDLMEVELSEIEAGYGNMWVPKERQYADVRQKYDDLWEQELTDAGYFVRPVFESVERWYDKLNQLSEEAVIEDPFAEFNLSTSVEEALDNYSYDFEIEYAGFTDEWEEPRFDPSSWYGYYTVTKSREYGDYSYSVPIEDILEDLMTEIIPENLNSSYIEKAIKRRIAELEYSAYKDTAESEIRKLVADYQKLEALCEKSDDEDYEKLEIFVADHLDEFFVIFYPVFQEKYRDQARETLR